MKKWSVSVKVTGSHLILSKLSGPLWSFGSESHPLESRWELIQLPVVDECHVLHAHEQTDLQKSLAVPHLQRPHLAVDQIGRHFSSPLSISRLADVDVSVSFRVLGWLHGTIRPWGSGIEYRINWQPPRRSVSSSLRIFFRRIDSSCRLPINTLVG